MGLNSCIEPQKWLLGALFQTVAMILAYLLSFYELSNFTYGYLPHILALYYHTFRNLPKLLLLLVCDTIVYWSA